QYKQILRGRAVQTEVFEIPTDRVEEEILRTVEGRPEAEEFQRAAKVENIRYSLIRDQDQGGKIVGAVAFHGQSTNSLYQEFHDIEIAEHIREHTSGRIVLVVAVYISNQTEIRDIAQLLATETLTFCMKKDYTYAVFSPYHRHITDKTS